MALVSCDFYSESLEMGASMTVLLPQAAETQVGLAGVAGAHGDAAGALSAARPADEHTAWTRYTSIERYAAARRHGRRDAPRRLQLLRR